MTDAREIIVDELDKCICPADPWADAIISRLTTAGFRILGPDEVAQLERIAKGDIPGVWQEKFEKAQKIASALGRKA